LQDLEAQTLSSPNTSSYQPPIPSNILPTTAVRTGRGGIGNYVASGTDLEQANASGDVIANTKDKGVNNLTPRPIGYGSGRGGAGNWRPTAEEELKQKEREEEDLRKETWNKAEKDVEIGLSKPPGAYLGKNEKWDR
jgi:hypothetical protein